MSMQKANRPLSELEVRAQTVKKTGGNNFTFLVKIAETRSPSAIYDLAVAWLTNCGLTRDEADEIAKATRWLAMIRRDYGEAEFRRVVDGLREE